MSQLELEIFTVINEQNKSNSFDHFQVCNSAAWKEFTSPDQSISIRATFSPNTNYVANNSPFHHSPRHSAVCFCDVEHNVREVKGCDTRYKSPHSGDRGGKIVGALWFKDSEGEHTHSMGFFVSSVIASSQNLCFSRCIFFSFLVKHIPEYCVLFLKLWMGLIS